MVHIYCGDGKGKTTAAMGLALRMAGAGKQVLIGQFFKNGSSGEIKILKTVPGCHCIVQQNPQFSIFRKASYLFP